MKSPRRNPYFASPSCTLCLLGLVPPNPPIGPENALDADPLLGVENPGGARLSLISPGLRADRGDLGVVGDLGNKGREG